MPDEAFLPSVGHKVQQLGLGMDHGNAEDGELGSHFHSQFVTHPFVATEFAQLPDIVDRREKLARIIETAIVPRLIALQRADRPGSLPEKVPDQHAIETLAHYVLDPNITVSYDYIQELREQGLSMEGLFVRLLEPTARYLGTMWDNDECDFIDVTLGVGRLQQLLAMFEPAMSVPALTDKRRVCMMTLAKEQHSFGVAMVEKFLWAGGWQVRSERGVTLEQIPSIMAADWYAVVGLTISSDPRIEDLAATIQAIRHHSCNPSLGIMVGGPPFREHPELAARVGADATAINAPTAVLLAQKLFNLGARSAYGVHPV